MDSVFPSRPVESIEDAFWWLAGSILALLTDFVVWLMIQVGLMSNSLT